MPLHLIGLVHHWIHLQNANHRAPCDAVEAKPKYAFDDLAAKLALPFMLFWPSFLGSWHPS